MFYYIYFYIFVFFCIFYIFLYFYFIKYLYEYFRQPNPTLATAAVYFHRFYMFHSFKEFPKNVSCFLVYYSIRINYCLYFLFILLDRIYRNFGCFIFLKTVKRENDAITFFVFLKKIIYN